MMWYSRSRQAADAPHQHRRRPSRRAVLGVAAGAAAVPLLGGLSTASGAGRRRELLCAGTWQAGLVHGAWFDPAHGTLTALGAIAEVSSNWVTAHPRLPVLYVGGGGDGGYLRAFRVDRATGATSQISEIATDGGGTAGGGVSYAGVDGPSGTLLVANFEAGLAASLPIRRDGRLGTPLSVVRDTGSGPSPRQQGPHVHHVLVAPGRRFALVTDFGADRVFAYPFDRSTGALSRGGPGGPRAYATDPGSGPRRLVFTPDGRTAYLLSELSADIRTLDWDARDGVLTCRQTLSIDTPGFPGAKSGAELALSRDGRFVYASSRGENTLVVFSVAARTGLLTLVQRISCGGTTPWGFSLHPSGRWLLVANKASGTVNVFAVDRAAGTLTDTGESLAVPAPDGFALIPA